MVETQPSAQSSFQKLNFGSSSQKTRKSRYQTFLVLSSFTGFLGFVRNILHRIVSNEGVTIKILVGCILKRQVRFKMKITSQNTCCIGRRAGTSGPRPSQRSQDEVEKYVAGTTSSHEHPSEPQNWENSNFGALDLPSPKNISNAKRIRWTREEHKEFVTAFCKQN